MSKKMKGTGSAERINGVRLSDLMLGDSGSRKVVDHSRSYKASPNNKKEKPISFEKLTGKMVGDSGSRKMVTNIGSIPRASTTKQKLQKAFSQSGKKGR